MPSQLDIEAALQQLQNQQNEARWNDHPWERPDGNIGVDMFGSLQDNPLMRMARMQQQKDAMADETVNARMLEKNRRPGETAQSIRAEVNAQFGLGSPMGQPDLHVGPGGVVVRPNPVTGGVDTLFTNPKHDPAVIAAERQAKIEDEQRKVAAKEIEGINNALYKLKPTDFKNGEDFLNAKMDLTNRRLAADRKLNNLPGRAAAAAAILSSPSPITPTLRPSFSFAGTDGGTNLFQGAFGKGLAAATSPKSPAFGSAEDVRAAFKSGAIDRATAKRILEDQFNVK